MGEKAIMGGADYLTKEELEEKIKEGYKVNEVRGDLVLPDNYYQKRGVIVGIIDPRTSRGLDFNNDAILKGVFKDAGGKYEKVVTADQVINEKTDETLRDKKLRDPVGKKSPEEVLAERKKNIRDNLYRLGAMVSGEKHAHTPTGTSSDCSKATTT